MMCLQLLSCSLWVNNTLFALFFIDYVLGVRLKVSSFEDLNEEQIEEQILKPVSKSVMLV